MHDLISRRMALDEKNILHLEMFGRDFPVVPVETLKALPPVDAVPVVRCMDCKHWRKYNDEQFGECMTTIRDTKTTRNNDYCSDGERKDGEHT